VELTLEQIKAWETHPVTKEIMSIIDYEIKTEKEEVIYRPRGINDMQNVAMRTAYSEGLIVGAKGLRDICASLKNNLKGDDDAE